MGNRAVITTAPYSEDNIGIYVHWNGGQESVEGFLNAARELEYRDPTSDLEYGMARLTQIIGMFLGGTTSVGIGICKTLDTDNGDNGVWLITEGWRLEHLHSKIKPLGAAGLEKAAAITAKIIAKVKATDGVEE